MLSAVTQPWWGGYPCRTSVPCYQGRLVALLYLLGGCEERVLCCCLEDWIGRELLSAKIREKYCCICMWEGVYLLLAPWTSRGGSTIKAGCWLLSVLRLKLRSLRETSHSPMQMGHRGRMAFMALGTAKMDRILKKRLLLRYTLNKNLLQHPNTCK